MKRMAAAGLGALRRYPLLCASLYLMQVAASALAGMAVARALASAFAEHPAIDRTSDLPVLIIAARDHLPLLAGAFWSCAAVLLGYVAVSWFTTAGLLATLVERPTGRGATAETFGGGGARNLPAFARLWLWCLVPYLVILILLVIGLAIGGPDLEHALDGGDVAAKLLPPLAPCLLVWWIVNTSVDFARIDLVRRQHKSAIRSLLRGFAQTFTDWRPLPHAALFYLVFAAVTAAYWAGTAGTELSLLALVLMRQAAAAGRFAAKIWLHGGQVELVRDRAGEPTS